MSLLHIVVSNRHDPGLDVLFKSFQKYGIHTKVLGMGSKTPIGHQFGAWFGLRLDLLKQELSTCPPEQVVLFTDAWDVMMQDAPTDLFTWIDNHPGKVLFAGELGKWPDANLEYPPLQYPFPFLNAGLFLGRARDILKLLEKPFDASTNDQRYYSHQFVDKSNTIIELDHKGDLFLCMYNIDEKDIQLHRGFLTFRGHRPVILHLNSSSTKQKWMQRITDVVVDEQLPDIKKPSQPHTSPVTSITQHMLNGRVPLVWIVLAVLVLGLAFLLIR